VQLAWASFVFVILGAHPKPRAPTFIDRLVLPVVYTMDLFMAPFLSALRNTTRVRV
jgi:hypothetical protein